MIYNAHEDWSFIKGKYREYRRLTVRECAKIQTFPDNFEIDCPNIIDAYKMIGNAVPVRMAEILATSIKEAIEKATSERKQQRGDIKPADRVLVGFYKGYPHWKIITHQGFYYVRADGRKGAMSIEDLMPLPRLLLLHSNDRMQLYEMTDIEPRYYDKDYIERLGFQPSGETYIGVGFDASAKYKLKEVGIDKKKIIIKERFAPYITTFGELIDKK
jgi:DNA (cytosine-5)-methyltransferase 1